MRHLKFTLRDLFWLLLVVAMGCAWFVDRTGLYYLSRYHVEQFSDALQLMEERDKAARAAGFHFDYSGDKVVLVPNSKP
jgi:hypothetical protein